MGKGCEYNLVYDQFFAVYEFLNARRVDGDITIDEYKKWLNEIDPEVDEKVVREECSRVDSVSIFGKSMLEVLKNMKSHVIVCEECKARYKAFVESQRRGDIEATRRLKLAGFKVHEKDYIDPDFFELYSH